MINTLKVRYRMLQYVREHEEIHEKDEKKLQTLPADGKEKNNRRVGINAYDNHRSFL